MTISRRKLIKYTAFGFLLSRISELYAKEGQSDDEYDDYFRPQVPTLEQLGMEHPKPEKIKKAKEILTSAPRGKGVAGIARYFAELKEKTDDTGEFYNAGWKNEWNPVIVKFFQQTTTQPTGDLTPWCAAFLCWCLNETGYKHPQHASSASFRNWGKETFTPTLGDIVVFGSRDNEEFIQGHGHVGLFTKEENRKILVLGGNQISERKHHAVSLKWLPKDNPKWPLKFHSYRMLTSLQQTG